MKCYCSIGSVFLSICSDSLNCIVKKLRFLMFRYTLKCIKKTRKRKFTERNKESKGVNTRRDGNDF